MSDDYRFSTSLHGYEVAEWCPDSEGKGPPTQVHILFSIQGITMGQLTLAIRLKSRRSADDLIAALQKHSDSVWPPK